MFKDVLKSVEPNDAIFEARVNGKLARVRFDKCENKDHFDRPLFVVYSMVCGPISPTTLNLYSIHPKGL